MGGESVIFNVNGTAGEEEGAIPTEAGASKMEGTSTLAIGLGGWVFCCIESEALWVVSATDECALKSTEVARSALAKIALPPKRIFISRFSCPVIANLRRPLRESVPFYDSTPGSRSEKTVSRSWGLASLMRCRRKN